MVPRVSGGEGGERQGPPPPPPPPPSWSQIKDGRWAGYGFNDERHFAFVHCCRFDVFFVSVAELTERLHGFPPNLVPMAGAGMHVRIHSKACVCLSVLATACVTISPRPSRFD